MTIAKYWLAATIPSVMICLFKTKKTAAFGSSVRHYSVVTEGNPGSRRHELMGVTWRFLSLFIKQNSHVIYKQIVQNTLPADWLFNGDGNAKHINRKQSCIKQSRRTTNIYSFVFVVSSFNYENFLQGIAVKHEESLNFPTQFVSLI